MIGTRYWAHGITIRATQASDGVICWSATVDYLDDGFASDDADTAHISTEGRLRTRYYVRPGKTADGLTAAIDAVKRDADTLGVEWRHINDSPPCLYVEGDGEDPDVYLPDGWRQTLDEQAERLGWRNPYAVKPATAP